MTKNDQDDLIHRLEIVKEKLTLDAIQAFHRGNLAGKLNLQVRRDYILHLLNQFRQRSEGTPLPRRAFLSYSSETGRDYADYVKEKLKANHKFDVTTGFEPQRGDEGNVLSRVLAGLNRSSIFIGILTKEYDITSGSNVTAAPSVWTVEEKGMALALRLPVVLLIDEAVAADYWRKTTPANVHHSFTKETFEKRADEAMLQLVQNFEARIDQYLRSSRPDTSSDSTQLPFRAPSYFFEAGA